MEKLRFPHPVFIVDVQYNGYGIARVFSQHGIQVVGFFPRDACYEKYSNLLKFVYLDGSDDDYLQTLIDEAKPFGEHKPVLIATSDLFQEFIRNNYDQLKAYFIFEIPSFDVLKVFLEKDLFDKVAAELNVNMPFSYDINRENAQTVFNRENITFPLIIKPKYRDNNWMEKYPAIKVFVASDVDELKGICNELFEIVDRLVLQEWIPGPDSNIYYCMAYIKPNGEVLSSFCGRKIHQHPILLGSTSSAEAANEPELVAEAIRILKHNGNYGFCSVEFKKHNVNGKFYVIEPTVGRINQQEITAALNGNDIVLDAYCYLANVSEGLPRPKLPNYYFIDEVMDLQSCFEYKHYNRFSWWEYLKRLRKRKLYFMYLNWRDPKLSLLVMIAMLKHVVYYWVRGRAKYHSNDVGTAKLFETFTGDMSQF
jgi:D-aspartate ligase